MCRTVNNTVSTYERTVGISTEATPPFRDNGEGEQFVEQVDVEEGTEQEIEETKASPPSSKSQSERNKMRPKIFSASAKAVRMIHIWLQ